MTAEELKEKIEFKTTEGLHGSTIIIGGLVLSHQTIVDRNCGDFEKAMDWAKDSIREEIARAVYDDQRREFYEAIQEFISWHYPVPETGDPWTGTTMSKASAAREKLLKLARYQPHSTDEKKINPL